ncbi:hypothetical protein ACMD2_22886 [Ananas comosus]|uniref:Uncharacterized protein n=1 Tax=Ananas comosus TaxID=4615 RepID=A0A199VQV1_ANACO|nr:hypothetical protein ACMD2_22886 [Ananas comosus]
MQLTVSSLANVIGLFRSGEKLQTKEWPSFLEIKGRVRFDALRSSSNSFLYLGAISQFCWKEGSPESGRVNLQSSLHGDERVGFAEPTLEWSYICALLTQGLWSTRDLSFKAARRDSSFAEKSLIGVWCGEGHM